MKMRTFFLLLYKQFFYVASFFRTNFRLIEVSQSEFPNTHPPVPHNTLRDYGTIIKTKKLTLVHRY